MPDTRLFSVKALAKSAHRPESTSRYDSGPDLPPPAEHGGNNCRYYSKRQKVHVAAIMVGKIPEKRILLGNKNDYSNGKDAHDALFNFYHDIRIRYPNLNFHLPVGLMYSEESVRLREVKFPERYYVYNTLGEDIIQEHLYAIGYIPCWHDNGSVLYDKMLNYLDINGFKICGNSYVEYPVNEISFSDEKHLVRVMIPVCKK